MIFNLNSALLERGKFLSGISKVCPEYLPLNPGLATKGKEAGLSKFFIKW
jgi:hypothetical protein